MKTWFFPVISGDCLLHWGSFPLSVWNGRHSWLFQCLITASPKRNAVTIPEAQKIHAKCSPESPSLLNSSIPEAAMPRRSPATKHVDCQLLRQRRLIHPFVLRHSKRPPWPRRSFIISWSFSVSLTATVIGTDFFIGLFGSQDFFLYDRRNQLMDFSSPSIEISKQNTGKQTGSQIVFHAIIIGLSGSRNQPFIYRNI